MLAKTAKNVKEEIVEAEYDIGLVQTKLKEANNTLKNFGKGIYVNTQNAKINKFKTPRKKHTSSSTSPTERL